jgi:alkylhydroperoxidase/carboxymuconolactone decarboxylase family protein YurZ
MMPEKLYDENAYYDFDRNYADAVALVRRAFGEERAAALEAAKGRSKRSDFMTAMLWGWFLHRPGLPQTDRLVCILGAQAPKGIEQPLRDCIHVALACGLHAEKVREALFILSVYGGIPTAQWALSIADVIIEEREREGGLPAVPPQEPTRGVEYDYYDFEHNYPAGVEMSIRLFGDRGSPREERMARMGHSAIGDFAAIHWGWLNQRPILSQRERALFLIGLDSAVHGFMALRDHVQWALAAGVSRDEIIEAMNMLYMVNGWPANREAMVVVTEWLAELERRETEAR